MNTNHPATLRTTQPTRVLIAEDSPTQAQRLQHILEQSGYTVAAAPNGRRALELARTFLPALIISDVVMPEMNGYELCRRIKDDPDLGTIPVILVTTLSDPHDVIHGLESRADNFILKPYDQKYLLDRIQYVLVNREMRQTDQPGMGLEIYFNGQRHFITSDRLQILNLLLSTYDAAIQRNRELSEMQTELQQSNTELQRFAQQLEDRVRERTRELEQTNEALRQANDNLYRTQQAAMQQERLRALGQMASGIAHDINNAISPVALYTESLLEREAGLSCEGREQLTTVQRAINDVAQTVARMREFYRPRETLQQAVAMDLNNLVDQVLNLTKARWSDQPQQRGATIDVRTSLAQDLPRIDGADSEIRDALTNLIFNALDAIPDGGVLDIRTGVVVMPDDGTPGVYLEVRDSGVGMDEETRGHCLEPFFTTKGERGTGLGLPMVYGMAQRHGAALQIESEPGAGTTMRLVFPRRQAGTSTVAAPDVVASMPQRRFRVLLVDDDLSLLGALQNVLTADGHDITAAPGGQAGIDAFLLALEQEQPFDVVITDLGMPYVDGRQVARSIRATSPATPIILLTGWGQIPTGDGETLLEVDRLLGKPPRLQELREAIAESCSGALRLAPRQRASHGG